MKKSVSLGTKQLLNNSKYPNDNYLLSGHTNKSSTSSSVKDKHDNRPLNSVHLTKKKFEGNIYLPQEKNTEFLDIIKRFNSITTKNQKTDRNSEHVLSEVKKIECKSREGKYPTVKQSQKSLSVDKNNFSYNSTLKDSIRYKPKSKIIGTDVYEQDNSNQVIIRPKNDAMLPQLSTQCTNELDVSEDDNTGIHKFAKQEVKFKDIYKRCGVISTLKSIHTSDIDQGNEENHIPTICNSSLKLKTSVETVSNNDKLLLLDSNDTIVSGNIDSHIMDHPITELFEEFNDFYTDLEKSYNETVEVEVATETPERDAELLLGNMHNDM